MKKWLVMVVAVLLIFTVVFGCAKDPNQDSDATPKESTGIGSEPKDSEDNNSLRKIGLVIKNETDPYWIDYIDGLKDACKEYNFDYKLFSNEKETDIEAQIELCNTVITQGYEAIVVSPLDSTSIAPFILACNEANTPVFVVDTAADIAACEAIGAKCMTILLQGKIIMAV
jgi:ribose transport system substrate-binding protein